MNKLSIDLYETFKIRVYTDRQVAMKENKKKERKREEKEKKQLNC